MSNEDESLNIQNVRTALKLKYNNNYVPYHKSCRLGLDVVCVLNTRPINLVFFTCLNKVDALGMQYKRRLTLQYVHVTQL